MNNTVSERRFRNSTFYKQVVPADLRVFISKDDFYAHLESIMVEVGREGFPISTIQRRIVHLRFVKDMTAQEIQNVLSINSTTYNHELKGLEVVLSRYYENFVMPYPLRIAILKTRNLNHKKILRKLYRKIPEEKITVISYIRAFYDELRGKYATGFTKFLYDQSSVVVETYDVTLLNKLYILSTTMCNNDTFLKYVTAKEKTKKETIKNNITKIEDYISRNNIKITL